MVTAVRLVRMAVVVLRALIREVERNQHITVAHLAPLAAEGRMVSQVAQDMVVQVARVGVVILIPIRRWPAAAVAVAADTMAAAVAAAAVTLPGPVVAAAAQAMPEPELLRQAILTTIIPATDEF